MPSVTAHATVAAPPEAVFAYAADPANPPRYVEGLTTWQHAGGPERGLGSQFRAGLQVGPKELETTVEITSYEEGRALGWDPVKGFGQSGRWTMTPDGDGTVIDFTVTYEMPGGILGRLIGGMLGGVVQHSVDASVRNLKAQVEQGS